MPGAIRSLLGERERFRPAAPESWRAVEEWVGCELPSDYKELVDGFGDGVLFRHLFIPHPEGSDPLLTFMREERRYLHAAFQEVPDIPPPVASAWDSVVPWAYHDGNGDVCLLVRDPAEERWHVAVAFRQCPGFLLIDGGVAEFLRLMVREKRFPRGWPTGDPRWESLPDSPLV
ncbi:SMI1/KNR4 family protein [Streptomyces sp. FXJ1.172]|uniref:SMI1/KNR4 family protein n=1 Tax=Streptomyces sp. FXJ1.172 TaxID=710705 RepID=UPI001F2A2692|nr:SMI1/KNR4 family protein [Streptomyces sp. FXJ1.172]WEO95810.1 SMI1/KNR4 family protein [Streptomyces sp. FXJ1.172]